MCVFFLLRAFGTTGPAVAPTHASKGGVSHKIQQLLNTLKRPKKNRRPIEEYYQDEDKSELTYSNSLSNTVEPPIKDTPY